MAGGGIKAGATICDILGIDSHGLSKRVLGVELKPFGVEPGKLIKTILA